MPAGQGLWRQGRQCICFGHHRFSWLGIPGTIFQTVRTKHAMTDEPKGRPNDRTIARQNRLRDALRENLKGRKSQSRGRTGQTTVSPEHCTLSPESAPSKQVEQDKTTYV